MHGGIYSGALHKRSTPVLHTAFSRVLFAKITDFELVKKFPAFYGTRRFITAFTSARHLSLSWAQSIGPGLRLIVWMFRNRIRFYSEELLALRPTPEPEDHPLSAVRDFLFNIFAATLHIGAVPPSATWGRAMPWWQRTTYHGVFSSNET
jgi:hypothetical protein